MMFDRVIEVFKQNEAPHLYLAFFFCFLSSDQCAIITSIGEWGYHKLICNSSRRPTYIQLPSTRESTVCLVARSNFVLLWFVVDHCRSPSDKCAQFIAIFAARSHRSSKRISLLFVHNYWRSHSQSLSCSRSYSVERDWHIYSILTVPIYLFIYTRLLQTEFWHIYSRLPMFSLTNVSNISHMHGRS